MGDAVVGEQGVGHRFVHADRAGQDAAAHIGDAGQLQQALDGAVLAPQAVEHRHHHVDVQLFHMAGRGEQDGPVVGPVGAEHAGHIAGQVLPAAVRHLGGGGLGVQPAALLGDADLDQLIPGRVHVVGKGAGRHAADFVLAGQAAEHKGRAQRPGGGIRVGIHFHSLLYSSITYKEPRLQGAFNHKYVHDTTKMRRFPYLQQIVRGKSVKFGRMAKIMLDGGGKA